MSSDGRIQPPRPHSAAAPAKYADKKDAISCNMGKSTSIAATGVRRGETIEGRHPAKRNPLQNADQSVQVRIQVTEPLPGLLGDPTHPKQEEWASHRRDDVAYISEYVDRHAITKSCRCGRKPGGCPCKQSRILRLKDLGYWRAYRGEPGVDMDQLEEWCEKGTLLSWQEILSCMGKHNLVLRYNLFRVWTPPAMVGQPVPHAGKRAVAICSDPAVRTWIPIEHPIGMSVGVCQHRRREAWGGEEAAQAICKATGESRELVDACMTALKGATAGRLRSYLQKAIRFGAGFTRISRGGAGMAEMREDLEVRTSIYATCLVGMLLCCPSTLDPRLQIQVRGDQSAFKRVGCVILLEDSFVMGGEEDALALACQALLLTMDHEHFPDSHSVAKLFGLVQRMVESDVAVDYELCKKIMKHCGTTAAMAAAASHPPTSYVGGAFRPTQEFITVTPHMLQTYEQIGAILRHVKALEGDYAMYESLVWYAKRFKRIPLIRRHPELTRRMRSTSMHAHHGVDQHCAPQMIYLVPDGPMGGAASPVRDLPTRMRSIFTSATGINPRRGLPSHLAAVASSVSIEAGLPYCEAEAFRRLQVAQRVVFLAARLVAKEELDVIGSAPGEGSDGLTAEVDPGEAAAAVGPVDVELGGVRFHAMLGEDPTDVHVMRAPSRNVKEAYVDNERTDDLFKVQEEDRRRVREHILGNRATLTLTMSQHKCLNGLSIRFEAVAAAARRGVSMTEGERQGDLVCVLTPREEGHRTASWGMWLQRGVVLDSVDLHAAPESRWESVDDVAYVERCLRYKGTGMVVGAREEVGHVCGLLSVAALRRALALLKAYEINDKGRVTVDMPSLNRDGKQAEDDMRAPSNEDPITFRALVVLSRMLPGALRCRATLQRFDVAEVVLLRTLIRWVGEELARRQTAAISPSSLPGGEVTTWEEGLRDNFAELKDFQRSAVEESREMMRKTGNMNKFVHAGVGHGKTIMGGQIVKDIIDKVGASLVDYVLWLAPNTAVKATINTLKKHGHKVERAQETTKLETTRKKLKKHGHDGPGRSGDGEQKRIAWRKGIITVVPHDMLRTIKRDAVPKMSRAILVADELDKMYGPSQRTAAGIELATNALAVLGMTGTAIRTKSEPLAKWLNLMFPFPVNHKNFYCALAASISRHSELDIVTKRQVRWVPLEEEVRLKCERLVAERASWSAIARVVREATNRSMLDMIHQEARAPSTIERGREDQNGKEIKSGVLLVVDNDGELREMSDRLEERGLCVARHYSEVRAGETDVLVMRKNTARGVNEGVFAKTLIRQPLAGNGAEREQENGRLKRMGQLRSEVDVITVCMEKTILAYLLDRQTRVDSENLSIESLGKRFGADIMDMLGGGGGRTGEEATKRDREDQGEEPDKDCRDGKRARVDAQP